MQPGTLRAPLYCPQGVARPLRCRPASRGLNGSSRPPVRIGRPFRRGSPSCRYGIVSSAALPDDADASRRASSDQVASDSTGRQQESGGGYWRSLAAGVLLLGVAAVSWSPPAHSRQRQVCSALFALLLCQCSSLPLCRLCFPATTRPFPQS